MASAKLNESHPRSNKRITVSTALFVWRVLSTKWPVSEASMAMSAVSLSRISPIMMTSGSARRNARIAVAKVRPIFGWIWTWRRPS